MKETEKLLKALANQRRLAILKFLNNKARASVGDVADEIKLSFKSTSKHLGILRAVGIIDREQVNLQMYYSLNKPLNKIVNTTISTFSNSRE
jgi:DNA-binding transcriptional ArsR family regulator